MKMDSEQQGIKSAVTHTDANPVSTVSAQHSAQSQLSTKQHRPCHKQVMQPLSCNILMQAIHSAATQPFDVLLDTHAAQSDRHTSLTW